MLDECKDLDEYFREYGGLLGERAAKAFAPLHDRAKDPVHPAVGGLVRQPFPAQAHVITAVVKAWKRQKSVIVAAEMGCIAGESEIYDPVAKVYRRVDQITEPFHVVSYYAGKAVVGNAHVPFLKGTRKLFRVTLSNGHSFLATDHHKICITHRPHDVWVFVSEVAERLLRRSEPCLLPSIEEPFLSASPPSGPRSTRTPEGSQAGCPTRCRSCGGRLHLKAEVALELALQQDGAHGGTHTNSPWGDLIYAAGHSQLCPRFSHLATRHSDPLAADTSPGVASEPRSSGEPRGQTGTNGPADPRSVDTSPPRNTTASSPQSASQTVDPLSSPLGEFSDEMVHVVSVIYERTDVYYDFTVDEYHNYVMAGVVHHNCGKSLIAAAACHVAAGGRPYRAVVMCPDHLLPKWGREIAETCPGATSRRFDSWRDVLAMCQAGGIRYTKEIAGDQPKPVEVEPTYSVSTGPGPHFNEDGVFVDQPYQFEDRPLAPSPNSGVVRQSVSRLPKPTGAEWFLVGRDQSKFEPTRRTAFATRRVMVVEKQQRKPLRAKGVSLLEMTKLVAVCPRCGQPVEDKDGNPVAIEKVMTKCDEVCAGQIEQYRMEGDECKTDLVDCGEPLWTFTARPYRWPPARIIHKAGRKFDYLVVDEAHEEKSADSAQANACGKLIASSRKVVALTGTLIGGYAEHLFPILVRLAPRSLIEGGFGWKDFGRFNAVYGKIETTYRTTSGKPPKDDGRRNSHSMGSSTTTTKRCRPGVMPQLFGDHLIDKAVFLTLEEVSDALPTLSETIVPVPMDPETAGAYAELQAWFRGVLKEMLVKGDKRLLGKMLTTLLSYPDHPYGWGLIDAGEYGSFQPMNLDPAVVRPKERGVIDICHAEKAEGRQTWVYLQMTQVRDCGERLSRLMTAEGLKVAYMRSDRPKRTEREAWIYKHGKNVDVCLSHPKLVETGLDLFAKDGNHNFPTLVFYQ